MAHWTNMVSHRWNSTLSLNPIPVASVSSPRRVFAEYVTDSGKWRIDA